MPRVLDALPSFNTERYTVVPLPPARLGDLANALLRDPALAEQVVWMSDKSAAGARREASRLERQAEAGTTRGWGIVARSARMWVGAVLARTMPSGVDLEMLTLSRFSDQGIADEVGGPLSEWLEEE